VDRHQARRLFAEDGAAALPPLLGQVRLAIPIVTSKHPHDLMRAVAGGAVTPERDELIVRQPRARVQRKRVRVPSRGPREGRHRQQAGRVQGVHPWIEPLEKDGIERVHRLRRAARSAELDSHTRVEHGVGVIRRAGEGGLETSVTVDRRGVQSGDQNQPAQHRE